MTKYQNNEALNQEKEILVSFQDIFAKLAVITSTVDNTFSPNKPFVRVYTRHFFIPEDIVRVMYINHRTIFIYLEENNWVTIK